MALTRAQANEMLRQILSSHADADVDVDLLRMFIHRIRRIWGVLTEEQQQALVEIVREQWPAMSDHSFFHKLEEYCIPTGMARTISGWYGA